MAFSRIVRAAFERWIGASTWHTYHPLDEQRFYRFVWTVLIYSRKRLSEQELFAEIFDYAKGTLDATTLNGLARHYSGLYENLYSFARSRHLALRD